MTTSRNSKKLLDYVNILQGTDSEREFSRGNTLPLIARPFGMTHWSPQTDEGKWLFARGSTRLQGIRATHQPSPWISDYGHFAVMAQTGPLMVDAGRRASFYRQNEAIFKPHYFKAYLSRYRTTMELTATERCSLIRSSFRAGEQARVLLQVATSAEITVDTDKGVITGSSPGRDCTVYFAAVVDKPVVRWGVFNSEEVKEDSSAVTGERAGAYVEFDAVDDLQVVMRIATSFISLEQAWLNLEREIGNRGFDEVMEESEAVWEKELGRIEVEGADEVQRSTFYSCLYRALLFPRLFHEYDASNNPIHFNPYDGNVHEGELCTDNGFWDTHRTVYSLLALIAPKWLGQIMRGWTNSAKYGGWFPRWASPGYRNCMIGTHMDNIVPDAYLRGIRDFDIETAYAAIKRDATELGADTGLYGRKGLQSYIEKGYVPEEVVRHGASCTQDYAYHDWGVAQIARVLGRDEEANVFLKRAFNYRNTYDPQVGFMRGRLIDGSWLEPFNEFAWGGPYVEGSAWQCSWAVPHDTAGLIELMGGKDAFVAKLDKLMETPPYYDVVFYGSEIHEMSEMAAVDFGQYAHSNQPSHHILYLFAAAGQPWKTQYWVRRVMDELYTPDTFAGDEDNGEMASWYILNVLGLYPLCPGHPSFVLGSPLFKRVTIHLDNGKTLTVAAPSNNKENVYVSGIAWNGREHKATWIAHEDLAQGGTLLFEMSHEPAEREFTPEELPYSLSREMSRTAD